ncbi:hypothetical protein B0H19DRAFT_1337940 [Mycena capillaripes]|nr:hypothetical protein B0H19DRAFT_1337940 [Mycena capillaripes]
MQVDTTPTVPNFPPPGLYRADNNRSVHYFFDDGSIFIRLRSSNVVYSVWGSVLSKRSVFFSDLASLMEPLKVDRGVASATDSDSKSNIALEVARKAQNSATGNGRSETEPLELQATEAEFEAFLECIFIQLGDLKARSCEFWQMVLRMADFFNAISVMETAIDWLTKHNSDPVLCLHLATEYKVAKWFDPAFRALVHTPLSSLTSIQQNLLGFSAYIILAETKAKIMEHRALSALLPPPVVHSRHCDDAAECARSWGHAWWGESVKTGVAIALIHPSQMPAAKVLACLPNINTSWHMPPSCRKLTVDSLGNTDSVFSWEDKFIAAAIKELKKF